MNLYDELKRRKSEGEALSFADVSEAELMELYRHVSDAQIAELYGVAESEVTERRRQYGITLRRVALETMLGNPEKNRQSRQRVFEIGYNDMAAAVAQFALREAVEDENGILSSLPQETARELCRLAHRRLAYVMRLLFEERWQEFEYLIQSSLPTEELREVVNPDDGGIRETVMKALLESAATRDKHRGR
jgi:hypothetical protein